MGDLLNDTFPSEEELNLALRRYFEVIYCDEIDIYIYLFGFSKKFTRGIKIEGRENLREALKGRRGGILLSAHFGGGFWILPFLKERGMKVHFFSIDIRKENYPSQTFLYLYNRLRNWVVGRVSNERVIYKGEGGKGIIEVLRRGEWVIVLFDVPPFIVRDSLEVSFLNRKAFFPKGIISLAKMMNLPILPFFSYLDEGKNRRIFFGEPFYVKREEEGVMHCVHLIEKRIIEKPDHWHFWHIADQFFANRTET